MAGATLVDGWVASLLAFSLQPNELGGCTKAKGLDLGAGDCLEP